MSDAFVRELKKLRLVLIAYSGDSGHRFRAKPAACSD